MNRLITLHAACICMCLGTAVFSCGTSPQTNRVLLIPREGNARDPELMLTKELGVMKELLEKQGYVVAIATSTGEPLVARTRSVQPDLKLTEVNVDDYCGIIMPCMAVGTPGPPVIPEAVEIVRKAAAQGKPVAAQYGAVITLAKAGVLAGKKYAYYDQPPRYDEGFRDGVMGEGVWSRMETSSRPESVHGWQRLTASRMAPQSSPRHLSLSSSVEDE